MNRKFLHRFIGTDRWKVLYRTYHAGSKFDFDSLLNTYLVVAIILFACLPIIATIYCTPVFSTLVFGVVCILSIFLRQYLKFPDIRFYKNLKLDLAITHTAFALGCFPAVFILIVAPEIITEHSGAINETLKSSGRIGTKPSVIQIVSYIFFISIWVSILEEIIYRGLLLSTIRRWELIKESKYRDIIAIIISSFIFGFAHYSSWGMFASIALVGLGIGFGIAYISTKERLLPLILYHFIFDLLSLSFVALK